MNLGLQLNMGLKLEQKLSQQMIQSLKLLQMNSLQLEQVIKQEIEVNPLLEMVEEMDQEQEAKSGENSPDNSQENAESAESSQSEEPKAESLLEDRPAQEVDWEQYFNEGFESGNRQVEDFSRPDPDEEWERPLSYKRTLQDYLSEQLADRKVDAEVRLLVEYLIACTGDDGFVRNFVPEEDEQLKSPELENSLIEVIANVISGLQELESAPMPVREAFHVLQSFDPAGVGARNLRESLLIQSWRIPGFSEAARSILENHYDLLESLKLSQLARVLATDSAQVQVLLKEIGALNPRPGRMVGDDVAPAVVPDLLVLENELGELEVHLNERSVPRLRVSRAYTELLQRKSTGSEEKKFIKEKLNSANWLIKSIDQRKMTMRRVMTAILHRQKEFFSKGPEHLKPMILQDIADEIGMHISTVNRVTNGKFVQTPRGVHELKSFFSSAVTQEDGSEVSAVQAQDAIKRLVENENPAKPLSDQQIVDTLEQEGLQVARRTVSKYREQLNILPSRLRKR